MNGRRPMPQQPQAPIDMDFIDQAPQEEPYMDDYGLPQQATPQQGMVDDLFNRTDYTKVVQELLTDHQVPLEKLPKLKMFWGLLGDTPKKTFFESEDMTYLMLEFNKNMMDYFMSMPTYELTYAERILFNQLRVYFFSTIKRSVGTSSGRWTERILLGNAIQQQISTVSGGQQQGKRGGFFNFIRRV